jgi:hypothetical protein
VWQKIGISEATYYNWKKVSWLCEVVASVSYSHNGTASRRPGGFEKVHA